MSKSHNPWPLGQLPVDWVRPEIEWARSRGFFKNDPREIVELFESTIAEFAGSKYAVSVDCCSHGIFLALQFQLNNGRLKQNDILQIPSKTYVSVPMQVIHAGFKVEFVDLNWSGVYPIGNSGVVDSAGRFTKGMFLGGSTVQVLSFQIKKTLPIGRGGMILLDDFDQYQWLKKARHDGRDLSTPYDHSSHVTQLGWHFYMTPEDAARGLYLYEQLPQVNPDSYSSSYYPDLKNWDVW